MTKGVYKRDIERIVPPHPAPHDRHEKRHRYISVTVPNENGVVFWPCCDKPETHPIHLSRRRKS